MEAIESNPSYYTKEEVNRLIEKMIIIMNSSSVNKKYDKLTSIVSKQQIEIQDLKKRIKILEEK